MQRGIECPVCLNTYDTSIRIPKNLSCGHSSCLPCLKNLIKAGSIACPKCRTSCQVTTDGIDKLPTNYGIVDVLDTLCQECKDQPWATRCNHCPLNLCLKCKEAHPDGSESGLVENLKALKTKATKLQEEVNDDSVINKIQSQGEDVIKSLTRTYEERAEALKKNHEESVSKVKAKMVENVQKHLEWKHTSGTSLHETRIFTDKNLAMASFQQLTKDEQSKTINEECLKRSSDLDKLLKSRPSVAPIMYQAAKDFKSLLAECDKLTLSDDTVGGAMSNPLKHPDYTAAKVTKVFGTDSIPAEKFTPWDIAY